MVSLRSIHSLQCGSEPENALTPEQLISHALRHIPTTFLVSFGWCKLGVAGRRK